eukprot:CAMPEP_0119037000 /NCGR_PEP_ID=MMETSP1177-20130426/5079_1 /TAXON_ID=2985 /ORGANISM="Ochromonas sp, Strain CCMP1899" /LENGTH=431 /DNA_ID=CAMNT_0006997645 /DNA_START=90 /DNA_END=1385 /DNA_ORIENTATION=-
MPTLFLKVFFVTIFCCSIIEFAKANDDFININNKPDDIDVLSSTSAPECTLYLAPSRIPGLGRGIIAGKDFYNSSKLTTIVTLAVNYNDIASLQLGNYVYSSSEDSVSMAEFGIGMLYNHQKTPGITSFWADSTPEKFEDQVMAHTTFSQVEHTFTKDIAAAEEIFCYYGDENGEEDWFSQRGIIKHNHTTLEEISYSLEDIQEVGHCLSHVDVKESTLPLAGKGLFSNKDFKKGDIVTVSPVLLLPKVDVEKIGKNSNSVLQNYCIASPNSSYVFFPIGYSPLINHGNNGNDNLEPELFWWDSNTSEKELKLNSTLETLSNARFAQLDIAYRATRDITIGEELFYDYGIEWLNAWSTHLAFMTEDLLYKIDRIETAGTQEDTEEQVDVGEDIRFRFLQFIGSSPGLFVPTWEDKLSIKNDGKELWGSDEL